MTAKKTSSSAASRCFPVRIFGSDWQVAHKKFNIQEFIEPRLRTSVYGRERTSHMLTFPLTTDEVGAQCSVEAFEGLAMVFDNSQLRLAVPNSSETILVTELQAKALAEETDPLEGSYHSYHMYAMRHFGITYSHLLNNHKARLAESFKVAFSKCARDEAPSGLDQRFALNAQAITASAEAIEVFKQLAVEGHVFSHYLLGVLQAYWPAEQSRSCVDHLLSAHELKQPDALAVMAEYLWNQGEFVGAVQSALLSLAGGRHRAALLLRIAGDTLTPDQLITLHGHLEASGLMKLMSSRPMKHAAEAVGPQWDLIINSVL